MWLISFFLLFFLCPKVHAADEFSVSQKIQYQIDISGNASVIQDIELKNNFSQIYPKEYQITLSSNKITNITGNDNFGDIIKQINQQGESTIINLVFNQPNLGKDQITKFRLNYNIPSLAEHKGSTWEIALPENQTQENQNQTETTINLPSSFGSLSFSSSPPKNLISLNNETQLFFTSSQKNQKILLIFGDYQLFDFKFKYLLENTDSQEKTSQITIPPETNSQKITYTSIEPIPNNIFIDNDGNHLAEYQLKPGQNLEVNISGQAKIIHTNSHHIEINPQNYLKKDIYWETDDSNLIQIAQTLETPKDIYDYVVKTLSYKTDNIDSSFRQGASLIIQNPNQAICTEFSDLFITLARIKGIPAREVQGFAYSNNIKIKPVNINTDVLHAWPQYYDSTKKAWVSVDPTWGKTTNGIDFFTDLDPNHFAFVFHGLNSQYPLPPGGYKNSQNIKTVSVEFAKTEIEADILPIKVKPVSNSIFQPPKLEIINPNLYSITNLQIQINGLSLQEKIYQLPPLSTTKINLPKQKLLDSFLPQNYRLKINLSYNNINTSVSLNNASYIINIVIIISIIITLIGFGGIINNHKKNKR
ncbi:MAG: transglutaminase-like domain-containing protein [Candidatus Shapirobacteria bacterium]|nr:transglutaminase-like domain-containing protein [Candidatus Shapirobacteria bacterium]